MVNSSGITLTYSLERIKQVNNFNEYYDQVITLPDGKETTFARLLVIDRDNLSHEFSSHAAWLGYIGTLTADAESNYEQAKLENETLRAEKDATARREFNTKNIKFTENMVDAWVRMDDEYIDSCQNKIECFKTYKIIRALETAMKEKGSMLISLGATMRQELDMTGLQVRLRDRD